MFEGEAKCELGVSEACLNQKQSGCCWLVYQCGGDDPWPCEKPVPSTSSGSLSRCEKAKNAYISMTDEQKEVQLDVAYTIYAESGKALDSPNDWQKGQEAVAWTIVNRINSDDYPDEAFLVISQDGQFAGYDMYRTAYANGTYHIQTWEYAFKLAGCIVVGNYASIPYPEGFTINHVSFRKEVGQDHVGMGRKGIITYGGNTFFY